MQGARWESIVEAVVSVPNADTIVAAREEDDDDARAELCGQVACAPRKVHREVYLSPPSTCCQ